MHFYLLEVKFLSGTILSTYPKKKIYDVRLDILRKKE